MKIANSINEMDKIVKEGGFTLLYLSRPGCGVCTALKPKINEMFRTTYPDISLNQMDMDEIQESAGHYSVFTIPAIIIWADGKEIMREARNISVFKIKKDLKRIYDIYSS